MPRILVKFICLIMLWGGLRTAIQAAAPDAWPGEIGQPPLGPPATDTEQRFWTDQLQWAAADEAAYGIPLREEYKNPIFSQFYPLGSDRYLAEIQVARGWYQHEYGYMITDRIYRGAGGKVGSGVNCRGRGRGSRGGKSTSRTMTWLGLFEQTDSRLMVCP